MNSKRTLRQVAVALTLLVAFLFQGTWALAGTTGSISGLVTSDAGAPISGATVKVTSASQSGSTTTDATGHFVFLSLAPDTYTVSIQKQGYQDVSFAGVVVFADQQQTLQFKMTSELKTIVRTTSQAASSLIKSGTTSDVYSVNAATAAKVSGLGGGGSLDQAYSAIATMPGAYVPVGQAGWYQSVYIRGGDYDQVGYEVDGVPVNRSFDNYPSNTASALGQQEVQVYTGAAPSNSEGQGLSGYINQVIKTGTYPGYGNADLAVGGPTFYHKLAIETGGATPDRHFTYYAGFGGYNQAQRYYDNNNGAGIQSIWGQPLDFLAAPAGGCTPTTANYNCYSKLNFAGNGLTSYGPGGELLGSYNYASGSFIADRESVVNFHFAIPHRNDAGRDDLQLLWQGSHLVTSYYNSPGEVAPYNSNTTLGFYPEIYLGGAQYGGQVDQPFVPGVTTPYGFPSAGSLGSGGAIPNNLSDTSQNDVGILKLQYQKNFGSNAYLRAYGYTVYSDWLLYGPNSLFENFVGPNPADYELSAHTRGLSATFADQINPKNLLQIQGSYTDASTIRDNNTQMLNTITGSRSTLALAVPAGAPNSGFCLTATGAYTSCSSSEGGSPVTITNAEACGAACFGGGGTIPATPPGGAFYAMENGQFATYNGVEPKFSSGSITDEWDPSDRLHINLGLRLDSFQFVPSSTTGGSRQFWFNAWNNAMCVDANNPGSAPVSVAGVAGYGPASNAGTGLCSALNTTGTNFVQDALTNNSQTQTFTVLQPRVSFTYTVNPLNVLRFSYGKYDQAPNTAFEQYNTLQQDLADFIGTRFYFYGRNNPTFPIRPEVSYNSDFSWEHQLKGTDMSFKVTPFYRVTKDQIEQFYLDQKTNFVSGVNVGQQTSSGLEFQFQKGDFSRNGFAALVSYTYTNARIKYSSLGNGNTIINPVNAQIGIYNSYTSQCAAGGSLVGVKQYGQYVCGSAGPSAKAQPCFTSGAVCVANPYYAQSAQGFLDPNGSYWPYDLFPGGLLSGSYSSFVSPSVATVVLNYKHDKWAITPALQFAAGTHYGFPISTNGFDPSTCTGVLPGSTTGDPRYPNPPSVGGPANAQTCSGVIPIPNPDTGSFDNLGAFTNPSRITVSTQVTYDISPRIQSVLTLANIFDTCFGGTKAAWTSSAIGVPSNKICSYGALNGAPYFAPVGNIYNPGAPVQQQVAHSYSPGFGSLPFNAYLDFKIKL